MNDDQITTNAEYELEEELNLIEGADGELLDPIEQNQVTPDGDDPEGTAGTNAKKELREAIEGNDDNSQDAPLDEENY